MRKVEIELNDGENYMIVGTDCLEGLRDALKLYHRDRIEHEEKALLQRVYELKQDENFLFDLQHLLGSVMGQLAVNGTVE